MNNDRNNQQNPNQASQSENLKTPQDKNKINQGSSSQTGSSNTNR